MKLAPDLNDTLRQHGVDAVRARMDSAQKYNGKGSHSDDRPLSAKEWLDCDIPPPDFILGEWFTTSSRAMIVGPTGLGKTMLGLVLAISLAASVPFLHWSIKRKCRVLYIDGEMPRRMMKRRLRDAIKRAGVSPEGLGLVVLSREFFDEMPPLNTQLGQEWMDAFIERRGPFDVIIFDNIQALLVGNMKDEEPWAAIIDWVRSLSRRLIGQIWFHHTGHDEGRSYGSKAREWQMDSVMMLSRLKDVPNAELAFSVEFMKAREKTPETASDFESFTLSLRGDQWERDAGVVKEKGVPPGAARALAQLCKALDDHGTVPPHNSHIPPHVRAVRVEMWREYCDKGEVSESDADEAKRKAFSRAVKALQDHKKACVWEGWAWLL
jgi:hypothetical protein